MRNKKDNSNSTCFIALHCQSFIQNKFLVLFFFLMSEFMLVCFVLFVNYWFIIVEYFFTALLNNVLNSLGLIAHIFNPIIQREKWVNFCECQTSLGYIMRPKIRKGRKSLIHIVLYLRNKISKYSFQSYAKI